MNQREMFKANVAMFIQAWMEQNWDDLQQQPVDVAMTVTLELTEAAIDAAQVESDAWGAAFSQPNPESMMGQGQDWSPSIAIA